MRGVLFILGQLHDADAEWLAQIGTQHRVPPGAAIIVEGQPAAALYIVLGGTLVAVIGPREQEVERLTRGTIAGEMSFVDGFPPSATVRAREESLVLAIPRAQLEESLRQDSAFAARFYKALAMLLAQRLRKSNRRLTGDAGPRLEDGVVDDDEMDPDGLDTLYQAGQRFDRLVRRLAGG